MIRAITLYCITSLPNSVYLSFDQVIGDGQKKSEIYSYLIVYCLWRHHGVNKMRYTRAGPSMLYSSRQLLWQSWQAPASIRPSVCMGLYLGPAASDRNCPFSVPARQPARHAPARLYHSPAHHSSTATNSDIGC